MAGIGSPVSAFFVFGKIQKSTFRRAVVVQFFKCQCYNRAIKRFGGKQ